MVHLLFSVILYLEFCRKTLGNFVAQLGYNALCTPIDQYNYLKSFYNSLDGQNWAWNSMLGNHWNFSGTQDPCEYNWQGITCNCSSSKAVPVLCSDCNVTGLKLPNTSLHGPIPADIKILSKLKYLDLSSNQITSTIPATLGDTHSLINVELGYNQLTGSVPENLGQLTNLVFIRIRNNLLNGTIPSSLAYLKDKLMNLNLRANMLTGTLPPELGVLSKVQIFAFFINSLTGTIPSSYGNLSKAQYFGLHTNSLTGTIPETLTGLSSVQYFWLYKNRLSGTIPESFGKLKTMIDFWVSFNKLSGSLPSSLATLPYIDKIIVRDNRLTGHLHDFAGAFLNTANLTILDTSGNLFTSSIPSRLFTLPKLRTVAFIKNCFSGEIPDSMCTSPALTEIFMDGLSSGDGCPVAYEIFGSKIPYYMSGKIPACLVYHTFVPHASFVILI